ncbi:N-acetyltransferase [Sphingomonas sp.]|uniref:GNAT family N-acetyltransferase n=1 Tax=Sphingomonas sp. TaxID=28214 RepID=UPI0031CFFB6A
MIQFVPLETVAPAEVEALLDRAFPPGRQARTAYKVRGAAAPIDSLCFAALDADGTLLGSIQCWPVALTDEAGDAHPMIMIGPVAVAPDRQRDGIGRQLFLHMVAAAETQGLDQAMMLIGDPEYYGRFFGFTAERTAGWRLPGPVERHRLLSRGDGIPALAGTLGPGTAAAPGLMA